MNVHLKVRPSRPEDEPDIRRLFSETEVERLCMRHWGEADRERIIEFQYQARQRHYLDLDLDQKECVIEVDGEFCGRFVLIQDAKELKIADIAILPRWKGMGIGGAIIESIKQEATQTKRPIRLMVERLNPALDLYRKLGFYQTDDLQTHLMLEWKPGGPNSGKIYFPPKE